MKSHVWGIVRPKEVVVHGEVRPLRDPQLDGVGLPVEVQHPHGGQACQAEVLDLDFLAPDMPGSDPVEAQAPTPQVVGWLA